MMNNYDTTKINDVVEKETLESEPFCQDIFFKKLSWISEGIIPSFFSLVYPLSVDI